MERIKIVNDCICEYCGIVFQRERQTILRGRRLGRGLYCSHKCCVAAKKKYEEVLCIRCQKSFSRRADLKSKPKCCSRDCAIRYVSNLSREETNIKIGLALKDKVYPKRKEHSLIKRKERFSKEQLEVVVKNSKSIRSMMLLLNVTGGSYTTILKDLIKQYEIDDSHFTRQASNKGMVSPNRRPTVEFLVKRNDLKRTSGKSLKRALNDAGIEYQCALCGLRNSWNRNVLVLQIDHVNGDHTDNRIENLRLLCPNCHSQTETWCFKNARHTKKFLLLEP